MEKYLIGFKRKFSQIGLVTKILTWKNQLQFLPFIPNGISKKTLPNIHYEKSLSVWIKNDLDFPLPPLQFECFFFLSAHVF